jgi:hypothetical protein
VTTYQPAPGAGVTPGTSARQYRKGSILADWLSSTDHKIIGHLYLITSFAFFIIGGAMAMVMRAQLMGPDNHLVSDQVYNELFTMHGTIMLLLFATPLFVGFANEIMPLQIGAPDVAFPRLNLLSYYMFLFGGTILLMSFLTPGGAAAFGWYAYSPLTSVQYSPGIGGDMWIMGLVLAGLGTILGGVNFVTTILCMRAPGMTMFRMPIFTWNILLTSMLVLLAFPVLAAALLVLEIDRKLGAHVAALVLVLRPSRGLYRGVAVLRHRHRSTAGLLAQAALRLQGPGGGHDRHRRPVAHRVGAPHVHHRRRAAAVLLVHDLPDRGAHRGEVLQLGRHDLARPDHVRCRDGLHPGLHDRVLVRRAHGRHPGLAAA